MMRALTYALTQDATAEAALEALAGSSDLAAIEAVVELLARPHRVPLAVRAVEILAESDTPLSTRALLDALGSPLATVRVRAVDALTPRRVAASEPLLARLLAEEDSWMVRRAAVRALAALGASSVMVAADDPHWRVRHALVNHLLATSASVDANDHSRVRGLHTYLRWRRTGDITEIPDPPTPPAWPFHDPDPFVLTRLVEELGDEGRCRWLEAMPTLLTHESSRTRSLARQTLARKGERSHLVAAVARLDDLREGAATEIARLMQGIELDRVEETARFILHLPGATPGQLAWAIDQIGEAFPAEEEAAVCDVLLASLASQPPRVRAALERLAARQRGLSIDAIATYDATHPLARAEALTPERAAALVASPEQETSWHVLNTTARLAKVPPWKFAPQPEWVPPVRVSSPPKPLVLTPSAPPNARQLGAMEILVPPVGLSGHYGLPVAGFTRAVEQGLNLLFWEPNYQTLTTFSSRLSAATRRELNFLAGTFEATPQRLLGDVDRALRTLRIERLAIFLVFWVRRWSRIEDGMRTMLHRLVREGKVAQFGLSTHERTLAVEAIDDGWNPVMVRHSLAHRGAEAAIFPTAIERGTSVITFNNTCYGRLLKPSCDTAAPTAADCYRYSLMQPGVTMCLSAPADLTQLEETLQVAKEPALSAERLPGLLAHGAAVYREETVFRRCIRAL